jgi:hypothetical protein
MAGITAWLNVNVFDGTGHKPYAPGAIVIKIALEMGSG